MPDLALELKQLLNENAIRRLAVRYPRAIDRRDGAALAALFTEQGAIIAPGVEARGRTAIAEIPRTLASFGFDRTYHHVHNHLVTLGQDAAEGEVYSVAHHLTTHEDGRVSDYASALTYRDRYVREDGVWLFEERQLVLQWAQTSWVEVEVNLPSTS